MTTTEEASDHFTLIKKKGKLLADRGYNILPILPKGALYEKRVDNAYKIETASGDKMEEQTWQIHLKTVRI